MQFFNKYKNGEPIFGNLRVGNYFRIKDEFYGYYLKIDATGDGDYCAVDLETGKIVTMSDDTDVLPISITEVYYVNV